MEVIFRLSPPTGFWILSAGVIAGLTGLTLFVFLFTKGGARNLSVLISAGVLALCVYLLILAPLQTSVKVGEGFLELNIPPYASKKIEREEVLRAYVVDWKENESLKPVLRTGGVSFLSYKAGWFRLKNGASALLMTSSSRVLCLELEDELILIAPDNFEKFIDEVNNRFIRVENSG
ncbi:MAG: hypothetical protein PWR13_1225 [Archaeoglobi archaeon]|nr:hypothetical protein [Candidatus Mnemosynella bozhongmuii]MDK2782197.1 hypothetical protein [Archaeoglobi archaeon]